MKVGELLGKLKNGASVFDRQHSHIHTEYEKIFECISAVLPLITPGPDEYFHYVHDFGVVIGESICVPTNDSHKTVFAQRKNRAGLTRFVKNVSPRPTSMFTVVLKRDLASEAEQYILVTAYVGEKAPEEPWDKHAAADSLVFWNTHALVWGSMPVVSGTETDVCPW